jgi:hypothetical protein
VEQAAPAVPAAQVGGVRQEPLPPELLSQDVLVPVMRRQQAVRRALRPSHAREALHCGELRWRCSCGTFFSRKDKLMGHIALFATGHAPVPIATAPMEGVEIPYVQKSNSVFLVVTS